MFFLPTDPEWYKCYEIDKPFGWDVNNIDYCCCLLEAKGKSLFPAKLYTSNTEVRKSRTEYDLSGLLKYCEKLAYTGNLVFHSK